MSCHLWGRDRRTSLTSTVAIGLSLLLSACGGDGTSVASIPPPPPTPTPTPTPAPDPTSLPAGTTIFHYPFTHPVDVHTSWLNSPTTRSATTDVVGLLSLTPGNGGASSNRLVAPGQFTITTAQTRDNLAFQYTLGAPSGVLPGGQTSTASVAGLSSWDINDTVAFHYPDNPYGDTIQYFGQNLSGFAKAADGSESLLFSYDNTRSDSGGGQQPLSPNSVLASKLVYDVGYSYVAMGEWSWRLVDMNGNTVPASDSGTLLFVNGDRTPSSGIPLSGSATYDARSLQLMSTSGTKGIPFTLTADFGQRLISTRIDQDYAPLPSGSFVPGIHVGGSASFTNSGAFDIPLTGAATWDVSNNRAPALPSQPVTGAMGGAFFGPNAEQVGGAFSLQSSGGTQLMQDAFVGTQHH